MMSVNGIYKEIDAGRGTVPVIISSWGRTLLPIRAIVEELGGKINWDGTQRKVTISFKEDLIELWIDNPEAKVNGKTKWIDENNHNVKPIIIYGRTMLPIRFVAENLGCEVLWDGNTGKVTIIYPKD
ncbi:MAG: copper amine oxidase N-terminal domain-containing protein [Caldisericia bacterium]